MGASSLDQLIDQIEAYALTSRPPLSSVLVVHHGQVLIERCWQHVTADDRQPIFSITKSFVSALVGLAVGDGKLNLSDTLADLYPEVRLGSQARTVTIQHLLTMTSGFELLHKKPDAASDLIRILLARPMASPPGEKFHYNSEDPNLLVNIVERAVGQSALDYAYERLFKPLDIWAGIPKSYRKRLWRSNKQGHVYGGFGLLLSAHELAVFGQFYLQCGAWQGEQILPADYVAASTTMQSSGGYPEGVRYGYYFWVATTPSNQAAFFASGMGGQYVYVVPALDLIVVMTTPLEGDGRSHRVMITRLVTPYIEGLPAA
jgi:CubicO group peptidase (beta-lactamase class C family)